MNSVYRYAYLAYDKFIRRRNSDPSVRNSNLTDENVTSRRLSDNPSVQSTSSEISLNSNNFEMAGPITNLPDELLELILFDHLDVESLKQCRQVCWKWDQVISTNRKSFLDKLCLCQMNSSNHAFPPGDGSEMTAYCQEHGGPPLGLDSLRLRNVYSFWNPLPTEFFSWMSSMTGISWLEIQSSQLKMSQLLEILGELPNIATLRITGDTLIHNPGVNDETELESLGLVRNCLGKNHLRRVRHLVLHFEDLHNFLISLDRLQLIDFDQLETLDLRGHAGNTTNVFRIGGVLQKLLTLHGNSLKVLRLDNFEGAVRGGLDTKLASSKYQLRSSLHAEFPRFLSGLDWPLVTNLVNLQEISFNRFPIGNMHDPNIQSKLVPFLHNAPNLRKFSISQLYFSDDLQFEKFVALVPPTVSISMTSVHLNTPNPNLENITEVLHCEQNILKYSAASVRLHFSNVDWRIIYLTWSSITSNPILDKYSHLLRKLELERVLFPIGDAELHFINREMKLLEDLSFESCDLSGLTDSGITGLSTGTLNRIWADDAYEPSGSDFIGTPINKLTRLRSIKLSNVGMNVTHISILRSFLLMDQLKSLTIRQNHLVLSVNALDKIRNRGNILVDYGKPFP